MNLSMKWKQNHGNIEQTYGYHCAVGENRIDGSLELIDTNYYI